VDNRIRFTPALALKGYPSRARAAQVPARLSNC
jgi:hypothetical protein